jgi:signal transduction histidine kinase/CheY-like chemotaxis protein
VKLLEKITGFSRYDQVLEPLLLSQIVESQRMRVFQSDRALILVLVCSFFYIIGLWGEVDSVRLLIWFGIIIALAITRVVICRRVEKRLAHSTVPVLYRNELMLYFSSLFSTLAVGSGYWWICLGSSERVVFSVVLLTLIYAIGTTINSSIQNRGFTWLLVSNLGQGIVFMWLVMEPADIEAGVAMLAITILLSEFGKRSTAVFNDSIHIREENREQNLRLEKDKLIVERSLNVARKANEEKNRFMAAASHDLRQPLHAMTLFLGSLRHTVTDSRTHELLDKIDETSTILHEQFNSLLDLSKFDAGVVTADESRFRLDLMLKNIADAAAHDAQNKNVSLHLYSIPVVIKSDMLLMERLLRNLINNAVQYTDKGSVSIQMRRQRNGLVISVNDTGFGISLEDQDKIFRDYYQVSNKARSKSKGSGLGLAIVKRIAALLAIKITLKSQVGSGSTFNVHLPASALIDAPDPLEMNEEETDTIQMDFAGLRILIVDDDASILDAMTVLLRTWGCSAISASSPEQVERLLSYESDFDLVMMDDMLHDDVMGLDIAIRLSEKIPKQRIIMATANAASARLAEIKSAGFEVLVKPVDYEVLRRAIVKAVVG